ncbi:unnamed protein product [Prorocentrum cordatum]|uniref:Tyr recombinase domain-containing protein n=1 Tax=Prorocentrum cordatum TaxID=2364126 RepID=A0ABN9QAQ8_9DINO|nr:unnamed protein product [Polarella glacialis]
MGDFGWATFSKASTFEAASSGLQVSPCALALSTSANACLSETGVWGAPVPLGAAVVAGGLGVLLGVLAVLLAQVTVCTCLVSVRIGLWSLWKTAPAPSRAERQEQLAPVVDAPVQAGDVVFLDCGEAEEPWHERLILASLGGAKYLVLTPDEDMYEEEIDTRSVADFRQAGPRGGLPAGLGAAKGQPVYRFTERPRGAALQSWIDAAEEQAVELRAARGLAEEPEPPPLADGGAPSGAGAAGSGSTGERADWVCVVPEGDVRRGAVYSLPNSLDTPSEDFVAFGQHGLYDLGRRGRSAVLVRLAPGETADEALRTFVASAVPDAVGGTRTPPPAEDARTLAIKRDAAGRRFRDLKSVADSSEQCEFEDWALSGPRTASYVVKEIAKQSGGPVQRHTTWKHENKLNDDEHSVVAHEMLSEILELACTYDQVDVANLASMEALARHLQFLEHKVKKKKETIKDFDSRDYYLGRTRRTGGATISPELLKWVAESAARDSAILPLERMVPRDLLPLPLVPVPPARGARALPRRSAQRIGRRSAVGRRVNDCIAALNNLYGEGDFCSKARPSEAQFSAVDILWQAVSDDKPPDDAPSPEAALVELLGMGSLGYGPDGPTVVAPYDRGLVSWPESAGCVSLLEVLPEPDRQEVIDDEYQRFVQDLLARDMVELRTRRDFEVGVFFVKKKSGRLRLIVDARAVNQALKRPPTIHMASTAALVNMEVEDGAQLEFSIQDIADCFYQFRVPDYMVPWFGMRPLRARQLGVKVVDGLAVSEGSWVYPCLRVLPMGFAWAMRWTKQAHRELLRRGGLGGIENELVDRQIAPSVDSPQVPRVVYVDNEIFVSSRPGATRGARRQAAKVMTEAGLPLHEVEESKTVVEALGLELDGLKLRARLARAKRWRLGLGTQELANALHLMPLLAVQFDLPWSGRVTCSDATLRGYAVQEADMEPPAVREVGRWQLCSSARVRVYTSDLYLLLRRGSQVLTPWAPKVYIMYTQLCLYGFLKASVVPLVVKCFGIYLWLGLLGPLGPLLRATWARSQVIQQAARARPVGTGGLTTLEQESITQKTRQDYARRLERFDVFCKTHGLTTASDDELEEAVVEYMELQFSRGEPSNSGAKLLAAIGHRDPRLHHAGRLLKLPRVARALQGWRRLVPPLTRAPAPWAAVAAIAVALIYRGQRRAALGVVLAADAYLRPGELLTLRADHVVPEELQSTKTRGFNDSILLDSPARSFLGPLLEQVAFQSQPMELLFPWSGAAFDAMFKEAAALVGLESWELTPYILRHSGPSHDWLTKARSLEAIKRRGRWASDLSVRRYEKGSRVMRRLASLDRGRQLVLATADRLLEGALRDGRINGFARLLQDVGLG